mmetsp:Transcript_29444/g.45536  ORF Transcript_29444/g.45536 Transcript_29444/m.45536 type:complete len:204 (-) Transcript_29444:451-1062(-)
MGVNGEDTSLVSWGTGEVENWLMSERELNLESILLGIELKVGEVVGNSEKDVVEERVCDFQCVKTSLEVTHSERKGLGGGKWGLCIVHGLEKDVEFCLKAETRTSAPCPLCEVPVKVNWQRPWDGEVVGERNVVDHRREEMRHENVEEDVDKGHKAVQQAGQHKANPLLINVEVEIKFLEGELRTPVLTGSKLQIKLCFGLHP